LKTVIKNIAKIQTGIFAKPSGQGDVVYLQARHFDENGQLLATLHPDLMAEDISQKHLLQPGDVLFAAKGTKNFAAVYDNEGLPAVASTSFFLMRIKDEDILPDYLAWFLNSPATQTLLKGQAIGTSMVSISKSVLENLEIPRPNLQTQRAILRITALRNQEKALKLEIETLREILIQQQITKAINT
jgi:restriction endonuclease S subunit